jgi:hypothetical protein
LPCFRFPWEQPNGESGVHHELVDKILVDGVEIRKEATAASSGYF